MTEEDNQIQFDYNALVDNLLQISPSYNPEKDKDKTADTFQIKEQREEPGHGRNFLNNYIPSASLVNLKILSNSGYLQQITPYGTTSAAISSGFGGLNKGITLNASNYGFNHALSD